MDLSSKSEEEKRKLIDDSNKIPLQLIVNRCKFKDDETLGYSFRLCKETKFNNQEGFDVKLNFNNKKNIMYDMMKLNYMRTSLVTQKKEKTEVNIVKHTTQNFERGPSNVAKKDKKRRKNSDDDKSEDDEENEKILEDNLLTKEKLSEYQARSAEEVKNFINSLKFFGEEISLFKRELTDLRNLTEDHYNKNPLIKQSLDEFNKKMLDKKKLDKKSDGINKNSNKENSSTSSALSTDVSSSFDYVSDTSSSLNNIFSEKSVTNIKYFSFFMFLCLCVIISVEFDFSLSIIQDSNVLCR
jgi:hypothetical protein